ncbi:MAG: hypothetical protein U0L92_07230 [Clostridia bacterium]|nr:hypothetical protein [Clostridia bacterium]
MRELCKELAQIITSEPENLKAWLLKTTGADEDSLALDCQGNLCWTKKGTGKRLLFLFCMQPMGGIVKTVQSNHCEVIAFTDADSKKIANTVCTFPSGATGILRENGENTGDLRLKPFEKVSVGDCFYALTNCECKAEKLYGCQASSIAILALAIACIKAYKDSEYTLNVAVVNVSASGAAKTVQVIDQIHPEGVLVCTTADADKGIDLDKGPGLVIKDGGFVAAQPILEKMKRAVADAGVDIQEFVGNIGDTLAQIYLASKTKQLAGIYLPVEEPGSGVEEMSVPDIEKTQKLLLKCAASFGII